MEFGYTHHRIRDFPGGLEGKTGSVPELGRSPGEGNGNPLQYPCLEKSHERRGLVGYTVHGVTESDMTEWLHFHFHFS